MCSGPISFPGDQMVMDPKPSSTSIYQPKEMCSSEDDNIPKMRKPYTITKLREKWTDEEHNKFIDALKLYGRTWRRIEEHVGSKTAVQIRSHAQKFFTKVIGGSTDASLATGMPVEIPPPRPKRKPLHPYPRKLGSVSNQETRALKKLATCLSPVDAVPHEEIKSPKSIFSAITSDLIGSPGSENFGKNQISSDSSSVVSTVIEIDLELTEQETGYNFQRPLVEENGRQSTTSASDFWTSEEKSDMETNIAPRLTSFQLFGKTVHIKDPDTQSTSPDESNQQHCRPSPSTSDDNDHENNVRHDDFSGETLKGSSGPWSSCMPPLFYLMPSSPEDIEASQSPTAMPLLAFYGGLAFPVLQASSLFLPQCTFKSDVEFSYNNEMQEESSQSSSEATFSFEQTRIRENSSVAINHDISNKKSVLACSRYATDSQLKGFVPYKR